METNIESVEAKLKKSLGDTYGGPALGVKDGEFVLYTWSEAGDDILGRGKTIAGCLRNASPELKKIQREIKKYEKLRRCEIKEYEKLCRRSLTIYDSGQ